MSFGFQPEGNQTVRVENAVCMQRLGLRLNSHGFAARRLISHLQNELQGPRTILLLFVTIDLIHVAGYRPTIVDGRGN